MRHLGRRGGPYELVEVPEQGNWKLIRLVSVKEAIELAQTGRAFPDAWIEAEIRRRKPRIRVKARSERV